MTDLAEPPLTESEAERRLPTLQLIETEDLRREVRDVSRFAPAYFWERHGSTKGYHNAHEHGLWGHTLKLSTAIDRLADSYVKRRILRPEDIDRAHAAAILHDQRKAGRDGADTKSDHDLLMADVVADDHWGIDDAVVRAIEEHMGPWYDGPMPTSRLSEIVHIADMIASAETIALDVQEPVPDELRDHGYTGVDLR